MFGAASVARGLAAEQSASSTCPGLRHPQGGVLWPFMPLPDVAPAQTSPAKDSPSALRRAVALWRRSRPLQIGTTLAVLLVAWFVWSRYFAGMNERVATPVLAIRTVAEMQPKALYFNAAALPWLRQHAPALLTDSDRNADSARIRAFVQAVQNPKLFRQLDRQHRFDTLLLVGDPSEYRPLLEHLLEAKDWTLVYLDHTSYLYRRHAAQPWTPQALQAVRPRIEPSNARERAAFLTRAAGKVISIREMAAGRKLLEEAEKLDTRSAELWSTWALYRMLRGEWDGAIAAADRALKLDPDSLAALGARAQALFSCKRFSEAYLASRRLIERRADDPMLLFYHAKIAHEARAFDDEIRTMRTLVALAEENQRPVSGYRIYLAQALAKTGEAEQSLAEFYKALADPDLPTEQRKFANEAMAMIRERSGMKKTD